MKKISFKYKNLNKKVRVDSYISSLEKSLSRSKIKKLILSNNMTINNFVINDVSHYLKYGDLVERELQEKSRRFSASKRT